MRHIAKDIDKFLQQIQSSKQNSVINLAAEELVKSVLDAEFASIWYYDEDRFVLFRERDEVFAKEIFLNLKKGIMYKCFMNKEAKLYNYLASDKDYVASVDNPDNIKIKSKIMLPLIDGENFIGIVTAYNSIKHNKKFLKNDMQMLQNISSYIINAIYKMKKPMCHIENKVIVDETQEVKSSDDDTLTFVSNFVHDIRTPANSLYGFLDLLESQIEDERLKGYIINAKESANFINELTTSVLNMVSSHKESVVSEIKEIDSMRFFSSIAESFASNMNSKNIYFNIYIDPMLPKSIKIDTLKMKRVVLNLISNAYKFTPKYKSIEFCVKYIPKTNKIYLYVKDTGIGIPKNKQETIFEAFKQAQDTTALDYGGTGLGLFISAKYVTQMGGELSLVSEVDVGSTFSFEIPLEIVDETPFYIPIEEKNIKIAMVMQHSNGFCANNIARHIVRMGVEKTDIKVFESLRDIDNTITHIVVFQNKLDIAFSKKLIQKGIRVVVVEEEFLSIDRATLHQECELISQYGFITNKIYKFLNDVKQPKVLIVDDDEVSVILIQTILENEFCTIDVARNGKEALGMIIDAYEDKEPFDKVYIDNNMPIMNGVDVLREIRRYEEQNNLKPLIAISTSGEKCKDDDDCRLYDIEVMKPFKKEQIVEALYY